MNELIRFTFDGGGSELAQEQRGYIAVIDKSLFNVPSCREKEGVRRLFKLRKPGGGTFRLGYYDNSL